MFSNIKKIYEKTNNNFHRAYFFLFYWKNITGISSGFLIGLYFLFCKPDICDSFFQNILNADK